LSALSEMVPAGTLLTLDLHTFPIPGPAPPTPGSDPEPACRFAEEPLHWLRLPAGTPVRALARAARRVYSHTKTNLPDGTTTGGLLIEVTPLPAYIAALLRRLPAGLPVQYVLLAAADLAVVAAPGEELCVGAGETLVTPGNASWLGVCLQDRICRDPRGWAHALDAAAQAAAVSCSAGWNDFVSDVTATGPARLRLRDHVGRPLRAGAFRVNPGGAPTQTVALAAADEGDTGVDIAGAGASVSISNAPGALLASADADRGALDQPLALTATDRHVLVSAAEDWLAERSVGVTGLVRWTAGNQIEPIVDGTPYFERLVPDLRAAKGGGQVELAGWAFVKEALQDPSKPWSLLPADNSTELLPLIDELLSGGAEVQLLVNQFLQISDADLATLHSDAAVLLFAVIVLMGITQAAHWITTDAAGWVGLLAAYSILSFVPDDALRDLLRGIVEPSKGTVEAINAAHPGTAVWTPYPAAFADNPLGSDPVVIAGVPINVLHNLGVYHQKIALTKPPGGDAIAYVGGIDINSDRVDDPLHRAIAPFHDVQVRLSGPSANEVAKVYAERASYYPPAAARLQPQDDSTTVPHSGTQVVQVGRTYFAPAAASGTAPFPSAPQGEHTTHDTLVRAIGNARDFIYIEDQYFTPDTAYVEALEAAADPSRGVRALLVTVPDRTDQPFGAERRGEIIARLTAAWQDRFRIGSPMRRYLDPVPQNFAGLGRMLLRTNATSGDPEMVFGPAERMPKPPFWAFVESELVYVDSSTPGGAGTGPVGPQDPSDPDPPDQTWQRVNVQRGPLGPGARWAAKPDQHDKGGPVLAVQIPGIYVHAKLMIVDDVFVSIGSSNLNRRGLEHDGEVNAFTVPTSLKRDPTNPALRLRCALWAEHLGLTPELGHALLADPLSALPYFDRSWFRGSRWQPLTFAGVAQPPVSAIGTAGSVFAELAKTAEGIVLAAEKHVIWASLVDPTTRNDTHIDPSHDLGPGL
jgi:phosphatidylserine/phosphatidylglycerophosphate/cardiolipin synthase-like enzyme